MKKFLSILLALVMVFSLMAPAAIAEETTTPGPAGGEVVDPEPTANPAPTENPEPTETPEVPAITVTVGNVAKTGKITLKWTAVDGAAKYEVYRSTTKTGEYKKLFTTTGLTMTNTGVTAGYAYFYKVKVLDTEGKEILTSDIVSRYADCAAPVVTAGNNAKTGKITLKWKAVDGADKYTVYRGASKDGEYTKLITTAKTSLVNSSAKANTKYYYKVVALSSKTEEANSAFSEVVARRCDCAAPVVTIGNNAKTGKITLKWKAVDGAAKYEVYRATSKTGKYTKLTTVKGTSLTNSSAKAGFTYYYKVKALSAVSTEANSAFSSVKMRACDCAMVSFNDYDYNNNGNPVFKWKKITGAKSYKIYRSKSENGKYTLLGETTSTTFTDKTAKVLTVYYYKIIAISSKTSSANSAAFRFAATPVYPMAKNLKDVSTSKVTKLKWDAISGVSGYVIFCGYSKNIDEMDPIGHTTKTNFTANGKYNGLWYAVVGYKQLTTDDVIPSMPAYVYVK